MSRIYLFFIIALAMTVMTTSSLPMAATGDENADWQTYLDSLASLESKIVPHSPDSQKEQNRHEIYLQMMGALTSGYLGIVQGDANHPLWTPFIGLFENVMAPNSDTIYMRAPINPNGVYRLRGDRGTVSILNLTVVPVFSTVPETGILADYDFSTLSADKDNNIEVILSAKKPAGYSGDWWPLDPRADFVMMRSVSENWGVQREPRIAITRIDTPAAKPRTPANSISEKIGRLPEWIEKSIITPPSMGGPAHSQELFDKGFVNNLTLVTFQGGLTNQAYYEGVFDIGNQEALIVETSIPDECRYRSILLADWMYATLDWVNNQSSLNRSQETIDSDGKLRFVISIQDPGVPNWLDTIGHNRGIIQGRWMNCTDTPLPSVMKVPVAEIRNHLPADTPIVTPEMRNEILRDRRDTAQMRILW